MNRQGQRAGAVSRPRLAAIATLLVVTCGLAAFLVLGSSASTQSVSASSAAQVAQAEPITGTLSKPNYTVIALAADGLGKTDVSAADGSFSVSPLAKTVSLHLRAPDGTYAGPVILAVSEAAIAQLELKVSESKTKVENSKTKVNDSGAKVRQAKKQVKRATKKVKKAKRKLKKASGRQAIRKARKNLRQAKKKLRRAKKRLRQAKKNLSKARAQLQVARNELQAAQSELQAAQQRQTGERAILGVRSASALGSIQVDSAAGFAKAEASTVAQWESWVDTERWAQASGGVPIGVGNFGRVSSTELSGSGVGDLDRDGVSDPLDIDDDGDLVLDNIDETPQGNSARVAQSEAGDFPVFARLQAFGPNKQPVNANAAGLSDAQIDAALPGYGLLGIRVPGPVPEEIVSAELDCGQPQGSPEPGLVYCTENGTGRINVEGTAQPGDSFPECCDDDRDGFGLITGPAGFGGGIAVYHGATKDQIKSGDVLIQRIERPDGSEEELVATVQYVFATTPTLASYDDGQGNSGTISYPYQPGVGDGYQIHVEAGPSGDVVVELSFWRPQRRPIPPETDKWIDMGGLDYYIAATPEQPPEGGLAQFCPQDSLSSSDPNLAPQEMTGDYLSGGGFGDLADDRPANPANLITFQVNLTECFEAAGALSEPMWQVEFGATNRTDTDFSSADLTAMGLFFVP